MCVIPRISLFIQARIGSTRLRGKVMEMVGGTPILDHLIERLRFVKRASHRALLIPTGSDNDILANYVSYTAPIDLFRGSEEDVLSRFYHAAVRFHSDIIVRITADCPLIDPNIVDAAIDLFMGSDGCSYVSTKGFPRGLDVEVFSFQALKEAFEKATDQSEREHVTLYLYRHPELFSLAYLVCPYDLSSLRITVDELDDLLAVRTLYDTLQKNPRFGLKEIYDLSLQKPELFLLNAHVKQKHVSLSEEARMGIAQAPQAVYLVR